MKMNVNTNLGVNTQDNVITLDDIKKDPDKIKDLDDKNLKDLFDESKNSEDFDTIISLAQELWSRKSQSENLTPDSELQKKLAEDQIKQDEEAARIQQELADSKSSEKQEENAKIIDDLKKQLEDSEQQKKTLEELLKQFAESEKNNRQENSTNLENIKNAKNSWNEEELKRLRWVIKNLALDKKALKDKFAGELPKYDSKEIATLKTRWIWFKLAWKMNIDGQTVLTWPQLLLRRNIRSRNRINKTVNKLNEIWKDPKKWVNYIMTKASLSQLWRTWTRFKNMKNFFTIRDTNKFDEVFNAHKKQFIDDLESKMSANSMSDTDKKTLTAIKARLDYYQKAYKRQFITV